MQQEGEGVKTGAASCWACFTPLNGVTAASQLDCLRLTCPLLPVPQLLLLLLEAAQVSKDVMRVPLAAASPSSAASNASRSSLTSSKAERYLVQQGAPHGQNNIHPVLGYSNVMP